MYRKLDNCWKLEDQLQNGSLSHPNFAFKQLHVLLNDIPASLRSLIVANTGSLTAPDNSDWSKWGSANDSTLIRTEMAPDSIVNHDALDTTAYKKNLLEIRVLSTFRSTVRVRGLAWEDTVADKYFYRKRISGDSTHSLNPLPNPTNGKSVIGG